MEYYPVTVEVAVAWGDMDVFGYVNNTVFFHFFETVRIAYFEAMGYNAHLVETGCGPILAHTDCRFKRPLTFPDQLTLGARVTSIEENRFMMEFGIWSEQHSAIAGEGPASVVSFDYNQNAKCPLPAAIVSAIAELES